MLTYYTGQSAKLSKSFPESYEGDPGGSLQIFWPNGASGYQLASVEHRKLIKKKLFYPKYGNGFFISLISRIDPKLCEIS